MFELKSRNYGFIFLILFFLFNDVIAAEKALSRTTNKVDEFVSSKNYAIIIGVNEYDDISNLSYAENDAQLLKKYFESQNYIVSVMTGYKASKERILKEIDRILLSIENSDRAGNIIFSFSGHGFQNNKINYLALAETKKDDLENTAVSIPSITKKLNNARVKQRLLFIDACRNDPSKKGSQDKTLTFYQDNSNAEGLAILYSTRQDSLSWESPKIQQGVFSYYLLEGLRAGASDENGLVTFNKLNNYVSRHVEKYVKKVFKEIQTPYVAGERRGKFIISKNIPNKYLPAMVPIEGGNLKMGDHQGVGFSDERPLHSVQIDDFKMSTSEITVGQFKLFIKETKYITDAENDKYKRDRGCNVKTPSGWEWHADANWSNPEIRQDDDHPVVCVSWLDAIAYAQWLAKKTGKAFRLPTEAEWEYAARAGSLKQFSHGNEASMLCRYANTADKTNAPNGLIWPDKTPCVDKSAGTSSVKAYIANEFGLYDIHGNAWEWVQDNYSEYKEIASSAPQSKKSQQKVIRGGSWFLSAKHARSAFRHKFDANYNSFGTGFRVVMTEKY